ncbi:MAG TPA: nuclear transport factor 2 family protein [Ramlibacter sp.]|nr:nuclear transport factor 2 family protein [Ramlibacter sp.]
MAFTGPFEDRLAIRELLDAYADAVCRRDDHGWAMTWAPDGVWKIRGKEIRGRDALRATWIEAMAAYSFVGFAAYPGEIRVDGNHATARVQTIEWLEPVAGPPRRQHGCYEDRLLKIESRWYFAERSYNFLYPQSTLT